MTPIRQLPNKTYSPPGGWRYKVPQTGQTFRGVSEYQLLCELQAHYRANQLPLPDGLNDLIEQFVCEQEPDYCTDAHGQPIHDGKRTFTHNIRTVLQGTATLFTWLVKGEGLVPAPQAEARASICVGCNFNAEPQGCTSCNSKVMRLAVEKVVGTRRTSFHNQLRSCRICSCQLAAKVHLPLPSILRFMPEEQLSQLPSHCWILKEQAA